MANKSGEVHNGGKGDAARATKDGVGKNISFLNEYNLKRNKSKSNSENPIAQKG